MTSTRWVLLLAIGWLTSVSFLHLWLNLHAFEPRETRTQAGPKFRVGFLPVT